MWNSYAMALGFPQGSIFSRLFFRWRRWLCGETMKKKETLPYTFLGKPPSSSFLETDHRTHGAWHCTNLSLSFSVLSMINGNCQWLLIELDRSSRLSPYYDRHQICSIFSRYRVSVNLVHVLVVLVGPLFGLFINMMGRFIELTECKLAYHLNLDSGVI